MIEINQNVKEGDLVYAWYSPLKEKTTKKPVEHEFRLEKNQKDFLSLRSTNGDYTVVFNDYLRETWFGGIRKA